MSIDNIPSIIQNGILCFDLANNITHTSIALNDVQLRRAKKCVPHGLRLHQYANLYFTYHNPMMYLRQDAAEDLCILAISATVLDIDGCVVTDRNAAAEYVRFYSPNIGIDSINFDMVFSKYWTHQDNLFEQQNHKAIKCAEVLIPNKIDFSYIESACVLDDYAEQRMKDFGFNKPIVIRPKNFFR